MRGGKLIFVPIISEKKCFSKKKIRLYENRLRVQGAILILMC